MSVPLPTIAAFDPAAATYDADFTHSRLGRWLRVTVWRHLFTAFPPGSAVLELGCGTGEDAVALALRGVRVHATDVSEAMLDAARAKARRHDVADLIRFGRIDLAAPDIGALPDAPERFDGAFSNFGALNCVADLRPAALALAERVRPGGRVVLVTMGPLCPWEWLWYGARGQFGTALRRLRRTSVARLDADTTLPVWYPSPRRLKSEFAPYFRPLATKGIGVLLPPSFARDVVARRPRLFTALARADAAAGRFFPGAWLNDHVLVILERQ